MPVGANGIMPPGGAGAGGGGSMDDLVSAAMMQRATGNPNAPVPTPPRARAGMPPMSPSTRGMPVTRAQAGSPTGNDPRLAALIQGAYRANVPRGR